MKYDAFLLLSFGGPEGMDDVMPFLRNVTRGRGVPDERLLEVAHHYEQFGGRSPINDQNRALIQALEPRLSLPIYWGNRNWHPLLVDTMRQMQADGITRAVAFATSAYASYSGCRQYLEDIERARAAVPGAPIVDKLPVCYNRSGFIEANADAVRAALQKLPQARLVFTAHSIPLAMAEGSDYVRQLNETARRVADAVGYTQYDLVYQSRSGAPHIAWLEPDILDYLRRLEEKAVVVSPIGFISDHMEVLYDLDTEAQTLAQELGIQMVRASTAGTHAAFVQMIADMVREFQVVEACRPDCCPSGRRHG